MKSMRKCQQFLFIVAWVLVACDSSPAAAPVSSRPATPSEWSNRWLRIRTLPDARVELIPGTDTRAALLRIRIFPVQVATTERSLPVPQSVSVAEQREGAGGTTVWRFSTTVEDAAVHASILYTTEFELSPDRPWIRRRCRFTPSTTSLSYSILKEIVLDETDLTGLSAQQPFDGWQSYPILASSHFWGVEFPVAQATVSQNTGRLAYHPGTPLVSRVAYDAWPVIYGVSPPSRAREAFEAYIETLRPPSAPIHIQYNSWWSLPFPYTQDMITSMISIFERNFVQKNRGRLDSFCIDLGWSNRQSIWEIDRTNFPQGFTPLSQALEKMNSRLGLWVSPSSVYPQAQDLAWAKSRGYETITLTGEQRSACLGGARYREAIKTSLIQMMRDYRIGHFKFDGYTPVCEEKDHGHALGELSSEQIALGAIDVFRSLRAANPQVWIEATCFGYRPSPWWLAYINTVIGTFGDDAPAGRTPCPVYRESYTTARDFFNLQGARDVLIPINTQEVLGVIHQTDEAFQNDAIVTALRGHAFIPLYINPKFMSERRWRFLGKWSEWVRANASLLAHTKAIITGLWSDEKISREWNSPVGRDPYGYAHFSKDSGLILIRNPWIRPTRIDLRLDESIAFPPSMHDQPVRNLYPRYGAIEGAWSYGSRMSLELGPYETRLIEIGKSSLVPTPPAPPAIQVSQTTLERPSADALRASIQIDAAQQAEQLLILFEGSAPLAEPETIISLNGTPAPLVSADSASGWRASGLPDPRAWRWEIVTLPRDGAHVEISTRVSQAVQVSAWVVAVEKPDEQLNDEGPLPPPEWRYLNAVEVIAPTDLQFTRPPGEVNVAALSAGARATASSIFAAEFSANQAIDGKADTRWNSNWGDVDGAWLQVDLAKPADLREMRFHEASGGRISRYQLQRWDEGRWVDVLSGEKTATHLQVRKRFPAIRAQRIRLRITSATNLPSIFEFELYGTPEGAALSQPATAP